MIDFQRGVYIIVLLIFSYASISLAGDKTLPLRVSYDSKTNQLTVIANKVKLKRVLANVAIKTGMEILMDPDANRSISANLNNKPLEKSLKILLRGTSYVFVYKKNSDDMTINRVAGSSQPVLMGVRVLQSGANDPSKLRRVVALSGEAVHHAMVPSGLAAQRWQERRNAMPRSVQEKLDAYVKHRLELKTQNKKRLDELKTKLREINKNFRNRLPKSWGPTYGDKLESADTYEKER